MTKNTRLAQKALEFSAEYMGFIIDHPQNYFKLNNEEEKIFEPVSFSLINKTGVHEVCYLTYDKENKPIIKFSATQSGSFSSHNIFDLAMLFRYISQFIIQLEDDIRNYYSKNNGKK
ncbi:hypothetical protein [Liquorilactobacillus hordei]|uniref:Uncharacterized protein n=1 Tax=Liquorilactobacillus hordei DSM 19519 TaxID=1423759 RepID=A0A0R1MJ08_9LACO|nr:hypothetical protein [Liquorilactobacillus hordei]KRL07975.1 hypothetical protein FC92_GL001044 [Liquorilactobacillus hordei DSM 19519]QYH51081.1 hypothetical protein G6O70_00535 [Liquorilactobacillus hordei DSM 19519]